jgi:hypothetical protein
MPREQREARLIEVVQGNPDTSVCKQDNTGYDVHAALASAVTYYMQSPTFYFSLTVTLRHQQRCTKITLH